jgi:hypothetical protein
MSRLSILIARPGRSVAVLATALAAVGVAVGAGADFTAQTANPSNTFSAGSLSMSNDKDNAAIFAPSNLVPGGPAQSGEVVIKNTGSVEGTFSLTRSVLTNSDAANPLADKINLVVRDCGTGTCDAGDPAVYTGTLADLTAAQPLGVFAAGDEHRYEFSASLDSSAGDAHQGDSSTATFQWDAVS